MKPFNLERALAGDKVVTRDGRKVLAIYNINYLLKYIVVAVIKDNYGKSYTIEGYTVNGKWIEDEDEDMAHDLFMAPTKKTAWINIYNKNIAECAGCYYTIYNTKEEAMDHCDYKNIVDCIQIEWQE